MFSASDCLLTTKDFQILQSLLDEATELGDGLTALLRAKLSNPHLVVPKDVPPDVATLYSRVRFNVDGGLPETRILVRSEDYRLPGGSLAITTVRGLALLGLGVGQSIVVSGLAGEEETIRIDDILYQPEAAQRGYPGGVGHHGANPAAAAAVVAHRHGG